LLGYPALEQFPFFHVIEQIALVAVLSGNQRLLSEPFNIIDSHQILTAISLVVFLEGLDFLVERVNFSRFGFEHSDFRGVQGHEGFLVDVEHEVGGFGVVVTVLVDNFGWAVDQVLFVETLWDDGAFWFNVFLEVGFDVECKTGVAENGF
jgi:hypothetical protein